MIATSYAASDAAKLNNDTRFYGGIDAIFEINCLHVISTGAESLQALNDRTIIDLISSERLSIFPECKIQLL